MTGPSARVGVLALSESSWMVVDPAGSLLHGYIALETPDPHDAPATYAAYDADEVRLSEHPTHEEAAAAVAAAAGRDQHQRDHPHPQQH